MKSHFLFFAAFISMAVLSSCTKENIPTAPDVLKDYTVPGLYVGTYSAVTAPAQGNLFYSFVVYTDGVLVTRGKAPDNKGILQDYYAKGTWTLASDSTFNGTIVTITTGGGGLPTTQAITAKFSRTTGHLTAGTWKDTINPNGTGHNGSFSTMTRVD